MFNRKDALDYGRRNAAPFSKRTGFSENFAAFHDEAYATERTDSFHRAEMELFEEYNRKVFELTGEELQNPLVTDDPFLAETPGGVELAKEDYFKKLSTLRDRHPDLPEITHQTMLDEIARRRAALRETASDVGNRSSATGTLGAFLGSAGAILTDPGLLLTLPFGAGAGNRLATLALKEGAIAAGSEVGIQAAVQAQRVGLDEGLDLKSAAFNVLTAGVGGSVLAGAIGGGLRVATRARKALKNLPDQTPEVRGAQAVLRRMEEIESSNPFIPTATGRQVHRTRLDQELDILRGRQSRKDALYSGAATPTPFSPEARILEGEVVRNPRPREAPEELAERVLVENPELAEEHRLIRDQYQTIVARLDEAEAEVARARSPEVQELRKRVRNLKKRKRTPENAARLAEARQTLDALTEPDLRPMRDQLRKDLKAARQRLDQTEKKLKAAIDKTEVRPAEPGFRIRQATRDIPGVAPVANAAAELKKFLDGVDPGDIAFKNSGTPVPTNERLEAVARRVNDPAAIQDEIVSLRENESDLEILLASEEGDVVSARVGEVLDELDEEAQVLDEVAKCLRTV